MIELVTTDGIFRLDGGEWEVTNNIWLVGDDREVVVVDAAHDTAPIVDAVAGRRVAAIALTHGHNDHINAAVALQDAVDAPILLHPDDRMLWHDVYPDREPDRDLADGDVLRAGGAELGVLHTPGHSPGRLLLRARSGGRRTCSAATRCSAVGPGATGRSYSDFPTIIALDPRPAADACRPRRSCTPATARSRRSAPRPPTSRSGCAAAGDRGCWPGRAR